MVICLNKAGSVTSIWPSKPLYALTNWCPVWAIQSATTNCLLWRGQLTPSKQPFSYSCTTLHQNSWRLWLNKTGSSTSLWQRKCLCGTIKCHLVYPSLPANKHYVLWRGPFTPSWQPFTYYCTTMNSKKLMTDHFESFQNYNSKTLVKMPINFSTQTLLHTKQTPPIAPMWMCPQQPVITEGWTYSK
jgi:hypothetical protein